MSLIKKKQQKSLKREKRSATISSSIFTPANLKICGCQETSSRSFHLLLKPLQLCCMLGLVFTSFSYSSCHSSHDRYDNKTTTPVRRLRKDSQRFCRLCVFLVFLLKFDCILLVHAVNQLHKCFQLYNN